MSTRYPFIKSILQKKKIVEHLASEHIFPAREYIGRFVYTCPLHADKSPSFYVFDDGDYQTFKCFGCLHEDELVWTNRGLIRIYDVKIGDMIININGDLDVVTGYEKKEKETISIGIGSVRRNPLILTPDHKCLILRNKDVTKWLPYIYFDKNRKKIRFSKRLKNNKRSKKFDNKIRFSEMDASEILVNDFFAFPIINDACRKNNDLRDINAIKPYKIGKKVKRIDNLTLNNDTAWLYGMYLAEGSYSGRCVKFTFGLHEVDFANRAKSIIEKEFNIPVTYKEYPKKNTCEIHISKVDFGDQISRWFGLGCAGKFVPIESLYWSKDVQLSFIRGWMDGDGGVTVSKKLAYGMYATMIQAGLLPTINYFESHIGKNGLNHRENWILYIKEKESLTGFIENIENTKYYISIIQEINKHSDSSCVIDISVKNTETFTTRMGVVHNCSKGGDLINLICFLNNCTTSEAIRKIAGDLNITENDRLNEVTEFIKQRDSEGNNIDSLDEFCLLISRTLFNYLGDVEYDIDELRVVDAIYQKIDPIIRARDAETLKIVYEGIADRLSKRQKYVMNKIEKKMFHAS